MPPSAFSTLRAPCSVKWTLRLSESVAKYSSASLSPTSSATSRMISSRGVSRCVVPASTRGTSASSTSTESASSMRATSGLGDTRSLTSVTN
ncbi:Uncharacterised protein [Mycobacterium tuberculosis]|uniref:Uncharacterized protein n=1 Tax=Mycobacterium tuberculosis TaxID=1773 RepID=A0A0U0UAM1_MYCTX|nr:Uncharacterised protein [Mycobacterium tuberculosis]COX40101.1 Uncharacterised protein [Mycobacterium tuberculosis]COZ07065.1 Uncharacterised protein [Mycobacterium tuberculosis]